MTCAPERLHGLDAVRGVALLLGVVLHAAVSFMPGADTFWIVSDADHSLVVAVVFYVIHIFRMTAFFLLAGFFGRMTCHRLGPRAFVKDRLKRIVLPLLVGWPVLILSFAAVIAWALMRANNGTLPADRAPGPRFTPDDFPLTHLWFLYVLSFLYAATLIARTAVDLADRRGQFRLAVDRAVRALMMWWAPVLLALPLAASLYFHHRWMRWFGIPTPDMTLVPNRASLVVFGGAFALGWLIHRQRELLRTLERRWLFNLTVAVASTSACLALVGLQPVFEPARRDPITFAYAVAYSIAVWSSVFAFVGWGLRFMSGFSPTRRYMADASYWIYLIHLPVVLALQVAMSRLPLPWQVKLPLLLAIAAVVLFLSYHFLVRYTFIGAVLNGRKRPAGA